jgi:hypothetical protein
MPDIFENVRHFCGGFMKSKMKKLTFIGVVFAISMFFLGMWLGKAAADRDNSVAGAEIQVGN